MSDLRPILLVEDNARDLELTIAALARCQLANEIVVARDGVEALDYLYARGAHAGRPAGDPAVVLLDLKLPRVNGLEVLDVMKKGELRHIPIVMLTSSRQESDVIKSYALGVNAFVVKPVDFGEFFKAIQDLGMFWAILNEPPPGNGGS